MKIAYFATQNINYIKPLKNEHLVAKKSYWFKLRNNEQLMAGYKCKYTTCIPETNDIFFLVYMTSEKVFCIVMINVSSFRVFIYHLRQSDMYFKYFNKKTSSLDNVARIRTK